MAKRFLLFLVLTSLCLVGKAQDDDTSWKNPNYLWTWAADKVGSAEFKNTQSEGQFWIEQSRVTLEIDMYTHYWNHLFIYYNDEQLMDFQMSYHDRDYYNRIRVVSFDNLEPGHWLKLVFDKGDHTGSMPTEHCVVNGYEGTGHHEQYCSGNSEPITHPNFVHKDYKYLISDSDLDPERDSQGKVWYDPDFDDSQWTTGESETLEASCGNMLCRWEFNVDYPDPEGTYTLRVAPRYSKTTNYYYRSFLINGNIIHCDENPEIVLDIPGDYLKPGRNVLAFSLLNNYPWAKDQKFDAYLYLRHDNLSKAEQQRQQSQFNQTVIADYPTLRAEGSSCWNASQSYYGNLSDEEIASRMGHIRKLLEVRMEATDLLGSMDSDSPIRERLQGVYNASNPDFANDIATLQQKIENLRSAIALATVDYFPEGNPDNHDLTSFNFYDGKLTYTLYPGKKLASLVVNKKCPHKDLILPSTFACCGHHVVLNEVRIEDQETVETIEYPEYMTGLWIGCISHWDKLTIPASVRTLRHTGYDSNWGDLWPGLKEIDILGDSLHIIHLVIRNGILRMPNMKTPPTYEYDGFGDRLNQTLVYIPEGSFHDYVTSMIWKDQLLVEGEGKTLHTGSLAEGELRLIIVNDAGNLHELNNLIIDGGNLNNDDWQALKDMKNLISIDMSGTSVKTIPNNAFRDRWAIKSIKLPSRLEKIGDEAFRGCLFSEIELPSTLTEIGSWAFHKNINLEEIVIPDGVTHLYSCTFYECNNLQRATLSNNITVMENDAFCRCDLRQVVLPDSLKTMQSWIFQYNYNLESVIFNEGLTNIGEYAFQETKLREVIMPSTMEAIGRYAFYRCDSLADVSLNEGLKDIYEGAFSGCKSLTEIVLPSTLLKCMRTPFSDCSSLVSLVSRTVAPPFTDNRIPASGFNTEKLVVTVPNWGVTDYKMAQGWKDFLNYETSDILPQKISIGQDFHLMLSDEVLSEYHPDIELVKSDFQIEGPDGEGMTAVGNLTVSSRSKLNANSLIFNIRPYGFRERRGERGNSLIINGEMRAEDVTLRMMMRNNRWDFFCVPFAVRVGDILPKVSGTAWVIREHDSYAHANGDIAHGWRTLTDDDVLQVGKGYIIHCYRNGEYWGDPGVHFSAKPLTSSPDRQALFRSDDRTLTLVQQPSEFMHSRNWNFLGNPYPSHYDTRFMQVEAPITVWNGYYQVYEAYSLTDDAYILHPGEAFFIQAPLDVTSMTLLKEGRQTHPVARSLDSEMAPHRAPSAAQRTLINLHLNHGDLSDRTRIVINEQASLGFESACDASKMRSNEVTSVQFYTLQGNTELAINERPLADGAVRLGLICPEAGSYSISLDEENEYELILVDHQTGIRHQLTTEVPYTFSINASGEVRNRFELLIGQYETAIESLRGEKEASAPAYDLQGRRTGNGGNGNVVIRNGHMYINK